MTVAITRTASRRTAPAAARRQTRPGREPLAVLISVLHVVRKRLEELDRLRVTASRERRLIVGRHGTGELLDDVGLRVDRHEARAPAEVPHGFARAQGALFPIAVGVRPGPRAVVIELGLGDGG